MNARELKHADAYLRAENAKYSERLAAVPREQWPSRAMFGQVAVMRSKQFLVQIFAPTANATRMSVCRTRIERSGRWDDGISWDELQRLKSEAGFGSHWAVEIFPPDDDVVNVANMRHLWLTAAPEFAWKKNRAEEGHS